MSLRNCIILPTNDINQLYYTAITKVLLINHDLIIFGSILSTNEFIGIKNAYQLSIA